MFHALSTLHLNADRILSRAPQEPPSLIVCIDLWRTLWGAHSYMADNVYQACMRIRCFPLITQKPLHYEVHRTKLATKQGTRLDFTEANALLLVALTIIGRGTPDPCCRLR